MNLEFNLPTTRVEKKEEKETTIDNIKVPYIETALGLYEKNFDKNSSNVEKIRDAYYTIFKQELNNTKVYKSSKMGVAFPYTSINTANVAKELFSKYSKEGFGNLEKNNKYDQEYVIGSFMLPAHGHEFTFMEEALHQTISRLPRALEDLSKGKEPDNFEIFTLGSPTNLLGTINEQFSENMKTSPFEAMSEIYTDFVQNQLAEKKSGEVQNINFYGMSMGGGMAAKTGEHLISNGDVTQELGSTNSPKLHILTESPVSLSESKIKKFQIPTGFVIDSVVDTVKQATGFKDKYSIKIAPSEIGFTNEVNKILEKRGIPTNMSSEQKAMKKAGLNSILFGWGKKLTIDPSVKINEIVGLSDLTMYTPDFNKRAKEHREEYPDTLGEKIVPTSNENVRPFGVNMTHFRPFYRESEYRRIKKVIETLENLQNKI